MNSSKEVFAKRKQGDLLAAYNMAVKLMNSAPDDEWNCRAFAWCLIDLIKQEVSAINFPQANQYLKQLNSLSIVSSDEVLSKSANYVRQIADPQWQSVSCARELSKAGNHEEAARGFRDALKFYPNDVQLHESLGWELYRLAKPLVTHEQINVFAVKRLLAEYLKLTNERPSLLHTCMLQIADKLIGQGDFQLVKFLNIWGRDNFREDDFKPFVSDDGKTYPSLFERIVQHSSKEVVSKEEVDEVPFIMPLLNLAIDRYPENNWLIFYKAKLLALAGDYEASAEYSIAVVKDKVNDFWSWSLLGDVYLNIDPDKALSCYCRSLMCKSDEGFLNKVRLSLAKLLIERNKYKEAKFEIDRVLLVCEKNDRKVPETVTALCSQAWYLSTDEVVSDYYGFFSDVAEQILFDDLPWSGAIVGPTFNDKAGKARRKLFLAQPTDKYPEEIVVLDKLCKFKDEGLAVRLKGEFDRDGRFTLYQITSDDSNFDEFPTYVAVIDHVNKDKKLVHCIVEKGVDAVVKFSQLSGRVSVGDCLEVKLAKSGGRGKGYTVISCSKTDKPVPVSVLKPFDERVELANGCGFTDSSIFIDPDLVRKHKVSDGDNVSGMAIVNFNRKKGVWGWKAIEIS